MAEIKNLRRRALLNKQLDQLKKDRVILLICLGVALSLWVPTKMAQVYRMEKKVRLEFLLPKGYTFVKPPPEEVKVLLEGQGWSLLYDALFSREMVLRFNAGTSTTFDLNTGRLRSAIFERLHSANLRIAEINYEELHLRIEQIQWKTVRVRFSGLLDFAPEHYLKEEIELNPGKILIQGPQSVVKTLEYVSTDSVFLEKFSGEFRKIVPVRLPPGLKADPSSVNVTIKAEQYTEKQVFVQIRPFSGTARFFPARVRISFRVGLSRFNEIGSKDFEVIAALPNDTLAGDADKAALRIIKKPALLHSVRMNPESVDYLYIENQKQQ